MTFSTIPEPEVMHIPHGCDLYQVRQIGRTTLPERFEEIFVVQFGRVFLQGVRRDYRHIDQIVMDHVQQRGYKAPWNINSISQSFNGLWREISSSRDRTSYEAAAKLYTDCFVAAVLACPITHEDIF